MRSEIEENKFAERGDEGCRRRGEEIETGSKLKPEKSLARARAWCISLRAEGRKRDHT